MRRSSRPDRSFLLVLAAVALAIALPCRADKTLTLQFTPKENVTANLPKLDGVSPSRPIHVLALTDLRPLADKTIVGENRERKKPRVMRASGSVAVFATQVLAKCLAEWGVRLGDGGLALSGDITNLFVAEENTYSTQVAIRFRLSDESGKVLWEGIANGDAHQWGRSFSTENYNEQISDALKRAFANLLSDEGFQKAWTGAASSTESPSGPAPVTPAALKQSILKMQSQGVAIDIVEGYVKRVKVEPPLSPDDIVEWKAAGIPDAVVRAALSR